MLRPSTFTASCPFRTSDALCLRHSCDKTCYCTVRYLPYSLCFLHCLLTSLASCSLFARYVNSAHDPRQKHLATIPSSRFTLASWHDVKEEYRAQDNSGSPATIGYQPRLRDQVPLITCLEIMVFLLLVSVCSLLCFSVFYGLQVGGLLLSGPPALISLR
jgi:hypothetical protein